MAVLDAAPLGSTNDALGSTSAAKLRRTLFAGQTLPAIDSVEQVMSSPDTSSLKPAFPAMDDSQAPQLPSADAIDSEDPYKQACSEGLAGACNADKQLG